MLYCALLLNAALAVVAGGHSSHSEYTEQLLQDPTLGARFSNDIMEDAELDVPELVRKYKYPFEEHTVTTEDRYILTMHRIPHGRDNNNLPDKNKPIVFLMHGLLLSSACFILTGPGSAFAYQLAEEGFDVWLGNARGNYYSRKHVSLNPDALLNTAFWSFSWDEIGNYDLPAMIDYVLDYTGKKRIHYVGYSQGTTNFFVMGSLRPEYNEKIISMHAFAPIAYMTNNRNLLLNAIAPYSKDIETISSLVGVGELLPNTQLMTWAGESLCRDEALFQPVCSNILFLIAGWNIDQHNATMLPVVLGHTPAGASIRQLLHYAQGIGDNKFRRYDHGLITNIRKYGTLTPPNYDLQKVTAPVYLHYSETDPLAHVKDVEHLFEELGRPVGKFLVPEATFSHLDFVWAIKAKELLFDRTINLIRAMDDNAFDETV